MKMEMEMKVRMRMKMKMKMKMNHAPVRTFLQGSWRVELNWISGERRIRVKMKST